MHYASRNCSAEVKFAYKSDKSFLNPTLCTKKAWLLTVFWDSGFYFHFVNLFFFLKMKDKVLKTITVISKWFVNYTTAQLVGLKLS